MWMILANNYWLAFCLVVGLPAMMIAVMRRAWLPRGMAVWLVLPLAVLCAVLAADWAKHRDQADAGAEAGHALLVLAMPVMLVWLFFSVIGFGLGFAIRAVIWRGAVAPTWPAPQVALVVAARQPATGATRAPEGGHLRVDFDQKEWSGNGHWINNPRVTVVATGAVVFDLWNTPADAMARFPDPDVVQLEIENWYDRRLYRVTIDLGANSYKIEGRSPFDTLSTAGPLRDLDKAYENATFPTPKLDGPAHVPQPVASPAPGFAWRSSGLILLAALGAIGLVALVARGNVGQGVTITPMQVVPPVALPQP